MSIKTKSLSLKDIETTALIDSGAQGRFIDESCIGRFIDESCIGTSKVRKLRRPIIVCNVDGTQNSAGRITHKTRIKYWIGTQEFDEWFLITQLGDQQLIFSMPWLKEHNPDIDWEEGTVTLVDWSLAKDSLL